MSNLQIDVKIAELITKAEKKEINYKEFNKNLSQLENLKGCNNLIK